MFNKALKANLVDLKPIRKEDLYSWWEIAYGSKADLKWKEFNGPYFNDPILTWHEFKEKFQHSPYQYLIWYEDEIAGCVSAYFSDGELKKWLELGIVIYRADLWGCGMGYIALLEWIPYLLNLHPELPHLGCSTWSGNAGMMKLAEKIGFRLEGRIRKVRFYKNEYYDSVKYGILREEWYEDFKEGKSDNITL